MGRVTVVGSINMDIVTRAPRLPRVGETIAGSSVQFLPGGKGANQAVAAARLGASTIMVGRVGGDVFGEQMLAFLRTEAIATDRIGTDPDLVTGVAVVVVQADGDNAILVIPGANLELEPSHLGDDLGGAGDVLIAQLEIPDATIAAAFVQAKGRGVTTMLNAAPARNVSAEVLAHTDLLVVNEIELAMLASVSGVSDDEIVSTARSLRGRPEQIVIVTLGARGAVAVLETRTISVPARTVAVVDTTGAGDCFVGALAAELAGSASLEMAMQMASAAASLCVQRPGAGAAMPTRGDVFAALGRAAAGD